jgi:hypothetical protein
MNTALAILTSLTTSRDKDYTNNDKNKPENEDMNENEFMDYDVNRPLAVAE